MGFLNTNPPLPRRGLQTADDAADDAWTGDRTGDRDEQRADQTWSHGSSDQDTNSKGSEYGAMNCSRPGVVNSSASHALDPGELARPWQRPRTRGSTPGSGCGRCARRTLPDAIVGAHPSTVPAAPLQAVHSSESARRCLDGTGLRTRQPNGKRTTCSLGFRTHTSGWQLANHHEHPSSIAGQIPAFDLVTLGLAVDCPCPAWQAADLGRPSGPSRGVGHRKWPWETWTNTTAFINHPATTAYHSHRLTDARSHHDAEFELRPTPATQPLRHPRPWKSNGTAVSPSARLLVSWSTRLHVCSRRPLVCHWAQCDGEETWGVEGLSSPSLLCCMGHLGLGNVPGSCR